MTAEECKRLDCHNGRFGFSLASAGDIDNDGFTGMFSLTSIKLLTVSLQLSDSTLKAG